MKPKLIVAIVLCFLVCCTTVLAANDFSGGDAVSGGSTVEEVQANSGNYWNGGSGMRVYVASKDGDIVSSIKDYTTYGDAGSYNTFFGYNSKLNVGGSVGARTGYSASSPITGSMPTIVDNSGTSSSTRVYDYFMGLGKDNLKTLMKDLGFSEDLEKMTPEEIENLYVVVEPVAYFSYKKVKYAGTAAEVAAFIPKSAACQPFSPPNTYCLTLNGSCASCLTNLTHRNLPLAIYVKDSHFNGQINGASGSLKYYESNEIYGSSGLGIGVFWFKDLWGGGSNVDCKINPRDHLPECCKEINNDDPLCKQDPKCITTVTPGVCDEENVGIYKDPDDWDTCIYNKSQYLDQSVGNEYCPVYCREEVTTAFPNSIGGVLAGQHFQWGGINAKGTRTCQSKVKLNTWYSDYQAANNAVASAWNTYQYNKGRANASVSSSACTYSCNCKTTTDKNGKTHTSCDTCPGTTNTFRWQYDGSHTDSTGCSKNPSSTLSHDRTAASGAYYQEALKKRDALIGKLKDCGKIATNAGAPKYNLEPSITLEYLEDRYGNSYKLLSVINETIKASGSCGTYQSGTCNQKNNVKKYECGGYNQRSCPGSANLLFSDLKTSWFDFLKTITDKDVDYNVPDSTYRYVLKPEVASQDNPGENDYIDIRTWNFPVHIMTPSGTYDIKLHYNRIGHQKVAGGEGWFDQYWSSNIYNTKYGQTIGNNGTELRYECKYEVENRIVCDPTIEDCGGGENPGGGTNPGDGGGNGLKGLNVVYRPIKLASDDPTTSFPGINGVGRKPGENWIGKVTTFIQNNRNVKGEEVYNLEPLYHIVLNPARIREIRDYNTKQLRSGGYADWTLSCQKGTGRRCTSDFIKTFFGTYGGSGTCYNASENNFYSCADKKDQ